MSIHFISGKPGGGKSLYAVKLIVDELLYGHRTIITNVPLKLGELNAYLQSRFPGSALGLPVSVGGEAGLKVACGVAQRVWLLEDEQTGEFWTYRPGGVRIPRLTKDQWQRGESPSYKGVSDSGVMYVIDEIHNFFGSRQWVETGRDVLFYLSQHRKLGDTVVCITQAVGNVDKQFRSVAQDYTFLRNLSKERYGVFRLPSLFLRKTYTCPPTDTSEPMESGSFRLDVSGLAACYDSARGVGIHGRAADRGERRSGFHWVWFFAVVAVVVLLIFGFLPSAVGALFRPKVRAISRTPAATSSSSVLPPGRVVSAPSSVAGPGSNVVDVVSPANRVKVELPVVYLTGIVRYGPVCMVSLSDGRTLQLGRDAELTVAGNGYAIVEGKTYRYRR